MNALYAVALILRKLKTTLPSLKLEVKKALESYTVYKIPFPRFTIPVKLMDIFWCDLTLLSVLVIELPFLNAMIQIFSIMETDVTFWIGKYLYQKGMTVRILLLNMGYWSVNCIKFNEITNTIFPHAHT